MLLKLLTIQNDVVELNVNRIISIDEVPFSNSSLSSTPEELDNRIKMIELAVSTLDTHCRNMDSVLHDLVTSSEKKE